jgi:hypothetical protein
MEALRKKERQDETQFTTKIDGLQQWRRSGKRKDRMKLSLPPKLMVCSNGGAREKGKTG